MKVSRIAVILFILSLVTASFFYFQKKQEVKYEGFSFIPEKSEDVPLYSGLKPDSPVYTIKGDHWVEIMRFYKTELSRNGWEEKLLQASQDSSDDGAGFISSWVKEGSEWELSIRAAYFKNGNQTEVLFDKRKRQEAVKWIETEPQEICINEQPDRSDECFKITDKQVISRIVGLINGAFEAEVQQIPYNGKSVIDFGSFKIDVYYDLEKGIYFVSEKGTKWMKPEKEFFELSRISKEY